MTQPELHHSKKHHKQVALITGSRRGIGLGIAVDLSRTGFDSKAGMAMMTALFAARLAEYGIGVFEIRPGIIATDLTDPVKNRYDKLIQDGITPIRRWGKPQDVGQAVAAIARGHFSFSTGEVFNIDGGFHLKIL